MRGKIISACLICCMALQCGIGNVSVLAEEPDEEIVEEQPEDTEVSTEDQTDEENEVDDVSEEQSDEITDLSEEQTGGEQSVEDTDMPEEQSDDADEIEEISEEQPDADDETVEYINGIPVDLDDPDCIKYLATHNGVATLATTGAATDYSTVWDGVTYYHRDDLAEGKTILPGIDVSKWEGYTTSGSTTTTKIGWSDVAADGIAFAFIRIGYTSASGSFANNKDLVYSDNMSKAKAAGIKVGVYYYSQAITVAEAQAEAEYVLSNLGGYSLDLPIVMDYEYYDSGGRMTSSTPNRAMKTEICNAFCKVIEDAGYTACVYANKDMLTSDLNYSDIENNYHIWLAEWKTSPTYAGDYTFWQSCGSGTAPTATVSGISGNVDLDWWYCDSDTVYSKSNAASVGPDIVKMGGVWTYTYDGVPDYTYTGLAKNSNGWYYIKDGVLDRSYTGFCANENGSWYIENGRLTRKNNSVIKDTAGAIGTKDEWYYVVGSKVQSSFTGLADYKNASGWWYITDGKVDRTVNTVAKNKNGWYYVLNGKVQKSFTGLADYKNASGWWYITNGKVDRSANTVAKNKNGWYYVLNGKVQKSFTGLADYKNASGWWYITNGRVDRSFTGIAKNKNGWYYIKNGKVQHGFTGTVTADGVEYSVKNGKVDKE